MLATSPFRLTHSCCFVYRKFAGYAICKLLASRIPQQSPGSWEKSGLTPCVQPAVGQLSLDACRTESQLLALRTSWREFRPRPACQSPPALEGHTPAQYSCTMSAKVSRW